MGCTTRPGVVSELRAGTGHGAAAPGSRAAGGALVGGGCRRAGCRRPRLRHGAGRDLEHHLGLEHLDRAVGKGDQAVELLADAPIGDLPLGGGRGLVDRHGEQLLGDVESLALDIREAGVLDPSGVALGDVEGDLEVGDRVAILRELLLREPRLRGCRAQAVGDPLRAQEGGGEGLPPVAHRRKGDDLRDIQLVVEPAAGHLVMRCEQTLQLGGSGSRGGGLPRGGFGHEGRRRVRSRSGRRTDRHRTGARHGLRPVRT